MFVLLAILGAILHFPRFRRAVGQFLAGAFALSLATYMFGMSGFVVVMLIACVGLYRPLPPRPPQQ